jgi:hypothetical protein
VTFKRTFKQTRVEVENLVRQNFGSGKVRFFPNPDVDSMAGAVMAVRDDRMALHAKVNAAQKKAGAGKICETKGYELFSEAYLLGLLIRDREPGPILLKDFFTESVVIELLSGDLLAREREAFLNPQSRSIQFKVIGAYRRAIHDDGGPPTLAEVRAELKQERIASLPKGWKLRNMVTNTFDLPLSQAKRGRRPK